MAESETDHIDSQDLAGFIDGGLEGPDRARVIAHLADCDTCRAEVAAIRGVLDAGSPRFGRGWIAAGVAAGLAGIVFAGSLFQAQRTNGPILREGETSLTIVTVEPDSVSTGDAVRFTWHGIGESATYAVRVTTTDGTLIWSSPQMPDTTVTPPAGILQSGRSYFWSVEALRADGRAFASRTRQFALRQ